MMTCQEFVDFIMAYLDEELPGDQRRVFEGHLNECPECLAYLDSYRETVALGKRVCQIPEGPLPEDVPERLLQAILAARGSSS